MTATQLAELAGMDVNYLWRIEVGRQNLSLRNVARLAKAMGITLSHLLEGVDVAAVELSSRTYARGAGKRTRVPKGAAPQRKVKA